MPPVSLAEIAKAAGVSRMTASRALRDRREVAPSTRAAVKAAAAGLGWRPNPEVGRLMAALRRETTREASQTLGLVWPDATPQLVAARPSLRRLRDGVTARAHALGFGVDEFFLSRGNLTARRLQRVLAARGIEGLIMAPVSFRAHGHAAIAWDRYAAVVIGAGFVGPRLNRVHHHHFAGVRLALREMRHRGFRRIGLLTDPVTSSRLDRVTESAFLMHHPLGARHALPLLCRIDDWSEKRLSIWLKKTEPEVVLCEMADPDWVRSVPGGEGVGYCTLNWVPEHPSTTGINQRFDAIGAAAVDDVAAQLVRGSRGVPDSPKTILTAPIWVPGATLARRARSAERD